MKTKNNKKYCKKSFRPQQKLQNGFAFDLIDTHQDFSQHDKQLFLDNRFSESMYFFLWKLNMQCR